MTTPHVQQGAANNKPRSSRRRFLERMAMVGGAAFFGASNRTSGQEPFDRAAIDESLKGTLFFRANARQDPDNAGLFGYDLATRKWTRILDGVKPELYCRASPDGKSFALNEGWPRGTGTLIVRPEGQTKVSELPSRAFWASASRQVILSEWDQKKPDATTPRTPPLSKTWRMNADGTGRIQLPIPENEMVYDWSPDGRWFLLRSQDFERNKYSYLIRRGDGTSPKPLGDEKSAIGANAWPGRFSPDSRWIAFTRFGQKLVPNSLWVIEVSTGQERQILEGDIQGYPEESPCWSTDGKSLAVLMAGGLKGSPGREIRLDIVDLQGHRIRQLGIPHKYPVPCDWR
jgi:Tol biopolymer transport system component